MSMRPSTSASAHVRRPPSSASTRPPSSASAGPSSIRPTSSTSVRPSSSASSVRRSTLSSRSDSRATYRPSSRHDYASSRQASRLAPLYRDLIARVAGLKPEKDEDGLDVAVDYVVRSLDQTIKPSGSSDMSSVQKQIAGLIQKARIQCNDELAAALEDSQKRLRELAARATDLDDDIQLSRLPSHLTLLLALSSPPNHSTLAYAENYIENRDNPTTAEKGLTWEKILAEEPFEGQHWEGVYGLPPRSMKRSDDRDDDDTDTHGSTPSLSPWDDDEEFDRDSSSLVYSDRDEDEILHSPASSPGPQESSFSQSRSARYDYRYEVEGLRAQQYWKPGWQIDRPIDLPFSIDNPSTLGPAFRRLAGPGKVNGTLVQERYISEYDAVREVLLGLQGIQNIILSWETTGSSAMAFVPAANAPSLLHLSPTAQLSILNSFAAVATSLEHLRKFVAAMFAYAGSSTQQTDDTPRFTALYSAQRNTHTVEAFAEAIDVELRNFDRWCAAKEEEMGLAQAGLGEPLVVSLLSLESALRTRFSECFIFILDILRNVVQRSTRSQPTEQLDLLWMFPELPKRMSPASITSLLLDSILLAIQERAVMNDIITSAALKRVFRGTANPLWGMLHRWLKDGMPIPETAQGILPAQRNSAMEEEFFIEDNELALLDPDFWCEGFVLRSTDSGQEGSAAEAAENGGASVPLFLQRISKHVLEAGKAVGLLRALGMPITTDQQQETSQRWLSSWKPFDRLLLEASIRDHDGASDESPDRVAFMASADDFARMVYDEIVGPCRQAKEILTRVLIDDCCLWSHLTAMEDLYLMRRGDIMSDFVDVLFARMDINLTWDDYHFLNSSFADVVTSASSKWIDPSVVRFSHHGKDRSVHISGTVRAIEGLVVQYAVPFPLTYIFGPSALQTYSSLFVFILQIRRAKNALERILVRDAANLKLPQGNMELKLFCAMRGRLSWFVNALFNFVCTNVLHTEVLAFHESFRKASSLDEMINLHNEHLTKMENRCLLQSKTAALLRVIISILDMTLHFSNCFVAFVGDMTHDISRHNITSTSFQRHRSRRQRRQRRNIIGFSQILQKPPQGDSDSSSDSEVEDRAVAAEPSFSAAASMSISFAEESFVDRVAKMSTELDALVRFIRRGVESLASGSSEAASAFEIFAFVLEDWDL